MLGKIGQSMNPHHHQHVETGLDRAAREGLKLPGKGRIGLLCNNATTDRNLRSAIDVLRGVPGVKLERIFSPQHGFAGEKQDNMVESRDGVHPGSGIPLISLYGRVREPEPEMLGGLDALVIDVPDVGTRVYTFLSTALLALRTCSRVGLPVVVLDRPNPIGGEAVEGPVLETAFASFVGLIAVPLRHGLTPGEYCLFGAAALDLPVDIAIIRMEGWSRDLYLDETDLPWVMPSPNLPTLDGTIVYPGMVMLEGTNLSEGRGTTRPFEMWGAPWLDTAAVRAGKDAGFFLREIAFQPTFHKHEGETVRGFQIHVTDRGRYRPVYTAVSLLSAVYARHPDAFACKQPPYEYETERLPIDLIAGIDKLRLALEAGVEAEAIAAGWREGEQAFREARRNFLLYD